MRRLLIGGLLALLPGAVLRAQPLDWPSLPYDYVAQGESLRDVLANFGANYDASVIVSDKVNDQVSGRFDLESPQAFLQLMASLYNLGWYYDGTVLYVFKTTEMQSRLVRLEQVGEAELKRALTAAGIWEPRFGWRADPSGRLVHVSGPGRYLELVEQTAQVLEQQYTLRSEKTGDLSVEIFPLRYAVAEDRKIEYRDDEIEAPGIASILSRVLSDANVVAVGDEPGKLRPGPQSSHAVVQAEPSLNAVVVRNPDALAEAQASDARRARGAPRGPLAGIPYTAKDSYLVKGLTAASGSPAFKDLVAQRDAFTVERLRAAGAICLGKTNMPPMANGGMQRGVYGRAESPYNAAYLTAPFASGSSNGAGTATAASFAAF
ncbi:amidase family protein, partial [Acinetobacter baumannii]